MASAPAQADSAPAPKVLTLEQALEVALSENASVKVADMEIEKTGYSRAGTYSALFPQINATGSYQRTIKKQVMYMDMEGFEGRGGFEVGRWNTWSAGVAATMPIVNAQLWESLRLSAADVELAVEKARSSRLETVTQVKQAYFAVLLAREAFNVYKSVYENAVDNLELTQKKYNAQRASELDLARAKSSVANAIPNVYDSESSIILSLWQLKAVMGVDLDENIDVAGSLSDFTGHMFYDLHENDNFSLENNSTMRQLDIQAKQLASAVRTQKYANLPTLSLSYSYSINAMDNGLNFSQYKWSPYSYIGLSLSIPIFAGGKRYHAIKQAGVQAAELDVRKADTERQLMISIRRYLNTMETSIKSYGAAQSAVETSTKAYDIARKAYEVGRNTMTDLNDAQLQLTQAKLSVTQAIHNFLTAKSNLEGVLGADFIGDDGKVILNPTYDK